ncbi:unnamed protein product [Cyprideis torosa]|uniref:DNA polymerase subunit gamma-1 n=1 Tax=Cyprideis torosa TaxID=163714 RepID=A0A7R8ZL04_9CRUS|nr:unnamed protein product [Cyprideis torosa]CAG0885501.1 unnamed protein product [Cyprideis torosa]
MRNMRRCGRVLRLPAVRGCSCQESSVVAATATSPTTIRHKSSSSAARLNTNPSDDNLSFRVNGVGIPVIPNSLLTHLFGSDSSTSSSLSPSTPFTLIPSVLAHLKSHGIQLPTAEEISKAISQRLPSSLEIPPLVGNDVSEHFFRIATDQCGEYRDHLDSLSAIPIPSMPSKWVFRSGWTKYTAGGKTSPVSVPDADALFFDVEVLVKESPLPVLAVAVSPNAWYSWCSNRLVDPKADGSMAAKTDADGFFAVEDLVPLGRPSVVVGHNVSYDRVRVQEEYARDPTRTRFVDTMSFHIAIAGLTSLQRAMVMAEQAGRKLTPKQKSKGFRGPPSKAWMEVSSLNSLKDVFQLYTDGKYGPLEKEKRDVFVTGTVEDVREDFQTLMTYCAKDCWATNTVFKKQWPIFCQRFPHPATLAGMLEMSTTYLPADQVWTKYLKNAEEAYKRLNGELKALLMARADEACEKMEGEAYKRDPWLWSLDWTPKRIKNRQTKSRKNSDDDLVVPKWYHALWMKPSSPDFKPGPHDIGSGMLVVPKLLRLTWDGYPLHYDKKYGWGYLVPGRMDNLDNDGEELPVDPRIWKQFVKKDTNGQDIRPRIPGRSPGENAEVLEAMWKEILEVEDPESIQALWLGINRFNSEMKRMSKKVGLDSGQDEISKKSKPGVGPFLEVDVPGCWFYKLPHKNGDELRVGNPIAKDFLPKITQGILGTQAGHDAERVLHISSVISYWRNARDRILSQIVVRSPDDGGAAIIPQMAVAGTLTRRAVESTWLTASNAIVQRVGSEIKSMICAPDGFHFVGADVDSQELWIAALLGDASFARMHGSTALGWMSLHGDKSLGTDLHSRTALLAGVTRDQAKVLNYGRIYGAGKSFAASLLRQFNPRLSEAEAKEKATKIYAETKGIRGYKLNELGRKLAKDVGFSERDAKRGVFSARDIIRMKKTVGSEEESYRDYADCIEKRVWMGGSESAMFNRLEQIASSDNPRTPALRARISRSLEPFYVEDNFMPSRINWVVQSSAVDFLHLLLVNMKWLMKEFNIRGRFAISIHDEVRYLVRSEDRYRAALCLQISNLLTRAMFSAAVGIRDLPASVAFFSSVEIDKVMRKDPLNPAITPSNPRGLQEEFGIGPGESLTMEETLKVASLLKPAQRNTKKVPSLLKIPEKPSLVKEAIARAFSR